MKNNFVFTTELIYSGIWDEYRDEYPEDEYSDETLNYIIYDIMEEDLKELKKSLNSLYPYGFLLVGSLGLWYGNPDIYPTYFNDAEGLINAVFGRSIEDIELSINEGELEIAAMHHDGTNHFTARAMTEGEYRAYNALPWYENEDADKLQKLYNNAQSITQVWGG